MQSRHSRLRVGGLMALVVAGPLACGRSGGSDREARRAGGSTDLRSRVVTSLGAVRAGEGRLVGFAYSTPAPPSEQPKPTGPSPVEATPESRLLARGPVFAELRQRLAGTRSPQDLDTLALVHLAAGRWDEALEALDSARAGSAADAIVASDLAAALLARSGEPGHESDVFAALDAAATAVAEAPDLVEARFNLAIALQRLGLSRQAGRAWREYLALDGASPWAGEATARLDRSAEPTPAERWTAQVPALAAAARAGDRVAVAALVDPFRAEARQRVERDLLAAWAEAYAAGRTREAAAALAEARAIGEALAALGGDRMAAGAVAAIDRAGTAAPGRIDALVRGHLAFRDGLDLDARYAAEDAAAAFLRADTALSAGDSPFAGWARLYLAIEEYQQGKVAAALALLGEVTAWSEIAASPALAGRTHWIQGLCLSSTGRGWAALAAFRRARERFDAAGEPGSRAVVDGLIADSMRVLGDAEEGLGLFARALPDLDRFPSERSRHAILDAAADAAAATGRLRAALALEDEILDRWGSAGDPTDVAFVHLKRSRLLRRLDEREEAEAEIAAAEARTPAIAGAAVRELVTTEIAVSRAELTAVTDPVAAEADLDRAIVFFTRRDRPYPLTQLYFARARLRLAAGDAAAAEADLRAALAPLERQRGEIGEAVRRDAAFARSEEIFAALVEILAAQPGRGDEAWAEAEEGRARALLDLTLRSSSGSDGAAVTAAERAHDAARAALAAPARSVPTGSELRKRLPPGVVLLEYAVLADETVAWMVRRDGVETTVLPVGGAELADRVDFLVTAIFDRRGPTAVRPAADAVADAILSPLVGRLRAGETVVFIPDGPLVAVPFAALPDPTTGRPLLEDYALVVAPSAALFVVARDRSASIAAAAPWAPIPGSIPIAAAGPVPGGFSTLVVGDPSFDEGAFPALPRLPGAVREARAVVALLPGARLLLGEEATPASLVADLKTASVVHLAVHAVAAAGPDPLLSTLVLARDGAGGTLTARDLLALRLPATRLVVLTACRAAGPAAGRGAWTLAHAFLAAGVPTVVANLWEVEDRAGERLAKAFYRHLAAGVSPAAALRAAQLEMLASPDPRDRDPAAWAGFRVIGAR